MKYYIGKGGKFTPFTGTTLALLTDLHVGKETETEIKNSEYWDEIKLLIDAPNTVFKCPTVSVNQLEEIITYKQIYSTYAIDSHDLATRHALKEEAMLVFSYHMNKYNGDLASFSYLTIHLPTLNMLYRKSVIDEMLETL